MNQPIRLALVLHNHQPIGNFDHVFQQAYEDSYLPFLDVLEGFESLKIALHTSGPLMEWLDERHPEYLERLTSLVRGGRVEIVGGAFYEPILAMIPARDRVGQIRSYTDWLESRVGGRIRGMWMPERVWEQSMASDLAAAGIQYTLLDDFHFKNAGLVEDQLFGYYTTEDDGHTLSVLPGSEQLRYFIPFQHPQRTIDYLGEIRQRQPNALVVFGDDGEKFGTWPETKKHVYEDGWLQEFFQALADNADWLHTVTPTEALSELEPVGKVYLPEGSYREMTEWALPASRQLEFDEVRHDLQDIQQWDRIAQFVRGGYWRNFKVKYPESNEMYARMMMVSRRVAQLAAAHEGDGVVGELIEQARMELYRGQCNCSYWHGAFGGIYLPHLRNAVYHHLIAADNLLHRAAGRGTGSWCEAETADFNFDGHQEILLSNERLAAFFAPQEGGQMFEFDIRSIRHNLLATLARRHEAYHAKVLSGPSNDGENVASIHERVVFKQEGLDQMIAYDERLRKSLQDHFIDRETTLEAWAAGTAVERGDFVSGPYDFSVDHEDDRVRVELSRRGTAFDHRLKLTKYVSLARGDSALEIRYLVEGLPQDRPLHFGVELNFAGLPAGADDRYFYDADRKVLGQLGDRLDLAPVTGLGLSDEWLGVDVGISCNRPTRFWAFPISSVSQSEGGFEAVHQSVVVMPHWLIQGDERGRWGVSITLSVDTSLAESRGEKQPGRDSLTLPFVASSA